jgi:hypothetical protein
MQGVLPSVYFAAINGCAVNTPPVVGLLAALHTGSSAIND